MGGMASAKGNTCGYFHNCVRAPTSCSQANFPLKSDLLSKPGQRVRRHPTQMGDGPM